MAESPVFVTGLPRTGKTPLRMAMGAHPRLSLTRKTRMWTSFHGRFGDLSDVDALESCLDAMLSDPGVARLLPDPAAIREEFAGGNRTYPELFGVFHAQYARRLGKPRWGEQTVDLEQHAEAILTTWPEAKIIHMIRLPSEWIASGSQRRPGGVGRELDRWSVSAELALSNQESHPDRYRVVHFETLMSEPIPALQEVVSFIDEESNFGMGQVLLAALPRTATSRLVPAARWYVEMRSRSIVSALGYPEPGARRLGRLPQKAATLWFGGSAGRLDPHRS